MILPDGNYVIFVNGHRMPRWCCYFDNNRDPTSVYFTRVGSLLARLACLVRKGDGYTGLKAGAWGT